MTCKKREWCRNCGHVQEKRFKRCSQCKIEFGISFDVLNHENLMRSHDGRQCIQTLSGNPFDAEWGIQITNDQRKVG